MAVPPRRAEGNSPPTQQMEGDLVEHNLMSNFNNFLINSFA